MTCYNHDNFDSDTGQWQLLTTNGATTLSGGKRSFTKTSGTFDETGMREVTGWAFEKGDTIDLWFKLDEAHSSNTYLMIGIDGHNDTSLHQPTEAGGYSYSDGGVVKIHGRGAGVASDSNDHTETMSTTDTYRLRWTCDATTGELEVSISGGVFGGSETVICAKNSVDISNHTSYPYLNLQVNPATVNTPVSIAAYARYDSDGLAPEAPADLTGISTTSSVTLSWDNSLGAKSKTGVDVERFINPGLGWELLATLNANADAYLDSGLKANHTYTYRVRAWLDIPEAGGRIDGEYSSEFTIKTKKEHGNQN